MATINDLVLVHIEHIPAFFARINDINPDVKKHWYQVELLVLELPLRSVVWILEDTHLQGDEFTMGGTPMRLEPIPPKGTSPPPDTNSDGKGKLIPLKRKT